MKRGVEIGYGSTIITDPTHEQSHWVCPCGNWGRLDLCRNHDFADMGRFFLSYVERALQGKGIDIEFTNFEYEQREDRTPGWRFDIAIDGVA